MKRDIIETSEVELKNLYLRVRQERMKSDILYNKSKKILIGICQKKDSENWEFRGKRR